MCSPSCGAGFDGRTRGIGKADRTVDRALLRPAGVVSELDDAVVRQELRVLQHGGRALGRRPPDAGTVETLGPDVERLRRDDLVQRGDDLDAVLADGARVSEARIGQQVLAAERTADVPDMTVGLQSGEEEPFSVFGLVRVHQRRLVGMPGLGRRDLAQVGLQAQVPPQHIAPGAQQRHLDDAAAAGVALLEHCGQQAGERGEPADVVADTAAGVEGDAFTVGQLHRQARTGPERADVVGRPVAVFASEPVAADAAVHEVRMALDRCVRLQAEAVERVGTKVGQEHVGGSQELFECGAGIVLAQVEHHAALPAVVLRKGRVGKVVADAERAEGAPHGIARGRLDLDHIGTPVGKESGGRRRGNPHAHLDDAQPGQRREALALRRGHAGRPVAAARSRRASFITLPVALSGSSSTISTARGTL